MLPQVEVGDNWKFLGDGNTLCFDLGGYLDVQT